MSDFPRLHTDYPTLPNLEFFQKQTAISRLFLCQIHDGYDGTPAVQFGSGSTWNRTEIEVRLVRVATRIEPNLRQIIPRSGFNPHLKQAFIKAHRLIETKADGVTPIPLPKA